MSIHFAFRTFFTGKDAEVRKAMTAFTLLCVLCGLIFSLTAQAQEANLPESARQQIDAAAQEILAKAGVPSASIAVVKDNRIACESSWAKYWLTEFFCDLFAVFCVGPAFVWSHLHLAMKRRGDPYTTPDFSATMHPADDAREALRLAEDVSWWKKAP